MAAIDIIIPLYNKAATVGRTIDSILKQTFTDWHLIIVNDGSTDNSLQVVSGYTDQRINIVNQPNQGPGAARNRGIAEAAAQYVAFLDADDEWCPWHLENSLSAIKQSDSSFVGSMYYEWPKQVDMTGYWARRNVHEGIFRVLGNESPRQVEAWILFFHVGTTMIKTQVARQYGGFYDHDHCCCGEDTIFFAKLVLNEPFRIISKPSVRHNRQDSGLSHQISSDLTPALSSPDVIMRFCPDDKKQLARLFLARLALLTAHHKARNGFKEPAQKLLADFPEMRQLGFAYYKLRLEILLSRWMPLWVKLKIKTGPPTRLFIRKLAYRLGLLKSQA